MDWVDDGSIDGGRIPTSTRVGIASVLAPIR